MAGEEEKWFLKPYLRHDLSIWIDASFRTMREKFRICVMCWTKDEYDLLIENAKELEKNLKSFIDYLERKRRFG